MSRITTLRCDGCERLDGEDTGERITKIDSSVKVDSKGKLYVADLCEECVKGLFDGVISFAEKSKPGRKGAN